MQIIQIRKIFRNNTIYILFFILLVACNSSSNSNNDDNESMPTPSPAPTMMPTSPPSSPPPNNPMPTQQPMNPSGPTVTLPPSPPTSPPNNPTPTQAPSPPTNPTPAPTTAPPNPQPTPTPTTTPMPIPTNPPGGPLYDFQSEVLNLVNDARSQSRNCGSEFFPAAPAVSWDHRVENAALTHSIDMAQNENFSHTGTDGSDTGDRLLMQGYNWSSWGENILVGLDNASEAINAWIGSPGHCSIIMSPGLEEVGAGVAQGIFQGFNASYWTLVFATAR